MTEGRQAHLDGLRGVAALVVMIEHLSALFPVGDWRVGVGTAGLMVTTFANFPFRAGTFAVYVFFVLSGIVIARSASGSKPWPLSLASRYLRLTAPMLGASLFACALLNMFPDELPRMRDILDNHWTSTLYQGSPPSVLNAINEAVFDVYWTGHAIINPVLWSMRVELYGSLGIFTFYRFVPPGARLFGLIGIIALLPIVGLSRYVDFPIGALFYELNHRSRFRWPAAFGLPLIMVGIMLGALASAPLAHSAGFAASGQATVEFHFSGLLNTVGAAIVVIGVMGTDVARTCLSSTLPRFFGRISYSLYLTHMPLFYTLGAAFYLSLSQPLAPTAMVAVAAASIGAAFAVGYVGTIGLDEPVTRWVRVSARRRKIQHAHGLKPGRDYPILAGVDASRTPS